MRARVIGIGNDRRGDDAVGLAVIRALAGAGSVDADLIEHDGEVADLVETLGRADRALIVDAALSGRHPGTLICLDAVENALPSATFAASTHALGLAEALELARALGRLPRVCRVYAVEAAQFGPGAAMTPAVAAAVGPVARRIRDDLARLAEEGSGDA